jgi:flavin-binding protein dodecin
VPVTTVTTNITVTSRGDRQEAIDQATAIATRTLANVERVEVKRVEALLENGNVTGYRITVEVAYGGEADMRPDHEDSPHRATHEYGSPAEDLRRHVLLEDLSEDEIEASDRYLVITPAERGSGRKDVSVNHDHAKALRYADSQHG